MARVYTIGSDWKSTEMERIHVRNEDLELQRILEMNHQLLPGDQINPKEPRRWLLIKREMPVPDPGNGQPRWIIDFLFADQDAVPTFVECKRFAVTRARREVVGQMIEYAANGHRYWDKETLRDCAEKSATKHGRTLEVALGDLQGPECDSPDEFFDRIQQNLREGQLRLVFFLEDSPPELLSVVEFLNKQMERSDVLLVEARQYRTESGRIVVPTLFGYTEEARLVKRSVSVVTASSRRQWDETSYFSEADEKLGDQARPLRILYDLLKAEGFRLDWGTGQTGSYNPKNAMLGSCAPITVQTDGQLWLNFGNLPLGCREKLRSLVAEVLHLTFTQDQKNPSCSLEKWGHRADRMAEGLVRIVAELRAAEDHSEEPQEPVVLVRSNDSSLQSELVLEIGGEGGSIKLERERSKSGDWVFRVKTDESGIADLHSEEDRAGIGSLVSETPSVHSFQEAISSLDKYPWFKLVPLYVHPDFLAPVLFAVKERGGEAAEARWRQDLERR